MRARDVATSSQAGAAVLRDLVPAGSKILAIGGIGVREALQHRGFEVATPEQTREALDHVVAGVLQGYGAAVTAADLAEAAYAVAAGAVWVATNTDAHPADPPGHRSGQRHPGGRGPASHRAASRVVVGKPHAPLYELCAARLARSPARVLAVGDRLDTDIAGAVAAGMDSVLVLTGVDSVTTLVPAPAAMRPTYLLEDLRSLSAATSPPRPTTPGGSAGSDRRRVVDGAWEVASKGTTIEAARAGVACLHEALDLGDLDDAAVQRLVPEIDAWQ